MATSILILGATSDIARAIAHQHAQRGDQLILAGRNLEELQKDQQDLKVRYSVEAEVRVFEATDYANHGAFADQLTALPDRVYCVFGLLTDQETAQSDWDRAAQMLAVNYNGAVSILERFALKMEERGSGCLVGVSSVAGERGRASNYFYGSAKAALRRTYRVCAIASARKVCTF